LSALYVDERLSNTGDKKRKRQGIEVAATDPVTVTAMVTAA
jgi:hypothetical protein